MRWPDVRQTSVLDRYRAAWLGLSVLVHAALFIGMPDEEPQEPALFELPSQIELGVADTALGGEPAPAPAPPPAQEAEAKHAEHPAPVPKPEPDTVTLPVDAGPPQDAGSNEADGGDAATAPEHGADAGDVAAVSGSGTLPGATGEGGNGLGGDGSGGYAPPGATIALTVDLQRIRESALLLETQALLNVIPEWELMLQGSGLDASKDLRRVFVATPDLSRSSLVMSAFVIGGKARVEAAVEQLAKERGKAAPWKAQRGLPVAPWWNRGPTRRVIAMVADNQFSITRGEDLPRLLAVAKALAVQREHEGFARAEIERSGGTLAMRPDETVAVWVEGARRYLPKAGANAPLALRFSINHVDQFTTELRAQGRYESASAASAALATVDALRHEWSNHPRVVFLGLKSALENAVVEQQRDMLLMHVQLTLHQTRFLLAYVSRALAPRDAPPPAAP